jgi:midasin
VDELTEKTDLMLLVGTYLRDLSLPIEKLENLVKFYLSVRKEAALRLTDGTGHKPHYRYIMSVFITFYFSTSF